MTENNLPRPTEPGTGAGLGPSNLFRTPGQVGVIPTPSGERGIISLQNEVENLAVGLQRVAKNQGTDSAAYRKALKRYQDALAKYNRERAKAGLNPISNLEELEKQTGIGTTTSDLNRLQNELKWAQDTYGTGSAKVKEIEQTIAEAQAAKSANLAPSFGTRGISQQGYGGRIPDLAQSTPIINEDGTISVVGPDKKPIAVGNRNLESVFIVFQEKNFYERGVKSTVKSVDYRTAEELRQQAFSFSKDNRKKLQEEFKRVGLLPSNYNANGELDRDALFENAFLQAHIYANQVNYNRLVNNQPLVGIIEAVGEYKTDAAKEPSVSRSISEFSISDGQAEALLEEFYTQALGVRPGKNDIEKFKEIVRKRAAKKPRVTQTTTAADGLTTTTKTIEEGFGAAEAQLLARRQAEARPEFAPYQMATTFYDSLLRAAQSPVRIQGPDL